MRKILICLVLSIFLLGCSSIPYDKREDFCKGMHGEDFESYELDSGFECEITYTDQDYWDIKYYKCLQRFNYSCESYGKCENYKR